jgi:transposase-like protein
MNCPKCVSTEAVKSGTARDRQRYQCKACGCHYTQSPSARLPLETRIKVIKLYLEGVGFRCIERLTGVHHTTVIKWVAEIERLRPELKEQIRTVELDEMWHFIQKKHKNAGFG